jgi:hypothetical protein
MKICILGDSHSGALHRAWQNIKTEYSQHELTFFASRGSTLVNLKIENKCLVSKRSGLTQAIKLSSGGLDSIEVSKYDLFLLYGLKANPCFLAGHVYLSRQLKEALIKDLLHHTPSYILYMKIRTLTGAKIYVGHTPLLAAEKRNDVDNHDEYKNGSDFLNNEYYDKSNGKIVPQPLATIVNGQNTDLSFTIGSKRLDVGIKNESVEHPLGDIEHMNDEYGKLWLTDFLKLLDS